MLCVLITVSFYNPHFATIWVDLGGISEISQREKDKSHMTSHWLSLLVSSDSGWAAVPVIPPVPQGGAPKYFWKDYWKCFLI